MFNFSLNVTSRLFEVRENPAGSTFFFITFIKHVYHQCRQYFSMYMCLSLSLSLRLCQDKLSEFVRQSMRVNLIDAIDSDVNITEAHFAQTERQQRAGFGLLRDLQTFAAILALFHF